MIAEEEQTVAEQQPQQPVFRVVNGTPTEEELAALTVVFAALAGPDPRSATGTQPRSSRYNSYWRALRRTFFTGRESWNTGLRQF